ncbi:MAG: D-2-hydroxyacid dehydrogenase [Planctomycetota bacterium]
MKIVVLDGYTLNPGDNPWTELESLGDLQVYERTASTQLLERAAGADVLITNKTVIDRNSIGQLSRLKFIAVLATGYNVVDVAAARESEVPVSNVPTYGTNAVAQHAFAMLLSVVHGIREHDQAVKAGEWAAADDFCFWKVPPFELAGRTMGIVGAGRIGLATARLAISFGMKVLGHSRSRRESLDDPNFSFAELEQVFSDADVISLHCPATPETEGMINRDSINLMKRSAILINTARGTLVNENDLAEALKQKRIAAACLDVLSTEPPAKDNPLIGLSNCIVTPHIAWAALEARKRLMATTVDNVRGFLNGTPVNVVN